MPDIIPPIDGDEKFATASDLGIPPYNWIPPETPPLQINQNRRKQFPLKNLPDCPSLSRLEPEGRPNEEHLARKDADLKKIPHPKSSFVHPDPPPRNEAALMRLPLRDVEAYRRLGLAFDWLVCRTNTLLTAINKAVKSREPASYQNAREEYIAFLQNLDDHEPAGAAVNPEKAFGYGRNLKWTFIDPVIEPETINGQVFNLITGAAIVAEWNPHSSSSGVPIQH